MKKLLCLLAALCLLWCAALPAAARAVTPGDVNADGQISASDALLILRQAVGKEKLSGAALQAADVTGKGDPNAADALCVLQKAVGTLRHFPCRATSVAHTLMAENLHYSPPRNYNYAPTVIVCADRAACDRLVADVYMLDTDAYTDDFFKQHDLLIVAFSTMGGYPSSATLDALYVADGELCLSGTQVDEARGPYTTMARTRVNVYAIPKLPRSVTAAHIDWRLIHNEYAFDGTLLPRACYTRWKHIDQAL